MKLVVCVVEARNLRAMDSNGFSDPYVKLQLERTKFKTKVVKKSLNPFWGEQFFFSVDDLNEEFIISVLDEDKYFNDDFVGQVKISISTVFDAPEKSLGTTWYSLQPKNKKSKNKDCGEILLTVYFSQNIPSVDLKSDCDHPPKRSMLIDSESELSSRAIDSPIRPFSPTKEDKSSAQLTFAGLLAQIFTKNEDIKSHAGSSSSSSNLTDHGGEDNAVELCIPDSFEDAMRRLESMDRGIDMPVNLSGGILLDQLYVISPADLNFFIFSPESKFSKSLSGVQGTTDLQQGPWKFDNGGTSLRRMISYVKAPTKLIKAVKGFEDQMYLKGDGKIFSVLSTVSTPEVVYGSTFRVELLFCVTPGPELPSGEQSSRLVISWRMNFLQNTMMKGMIEGGARQGLKESFEQYASLLAENVKPVDRKDSVGSNKEQVLASLEAETLSDWRLAVRFFANFTVVSTLFVAIFVSVHIWIATPSANQGLEFSGLDFPDSVGEVIVCAILVLQGKRGLEMIGRFINARVKRGCDHGVKAQGDGWLLTVALIEGSNLAAVDSSGFSDPYVVFTCNGKAKTSSIKFQQSDPQWNEIYEFDAMDEPPSVLAVEVYDFDGPFDEATSLGHVEINFVKMTILDLEDIWVSLEGKLAKACQSKLHLRIFLNNTRSDAVKDYLTKMEKEVGKKINVRSPQTNSAFQKLFGLPPEEFLINDFTCHLKRKMPLQGRIFLSPRIVGFHANLFGHKAKFFFLWEDIEDIQVVSPTLSSMGSPSIVMILRQGRGMDAKHGAKTLDKDGRLKFHFQSFVSFNVAHRTLMALWKARSLSPEQKVQIVEEDSEAKTLLTEESGSFGGQEDLTMSEIYATFIPLRINSIMELFSGCELERKVMAKVGCDGYSSSRWEAEKTDVYQRQVCYKFSERISHYKGDVTSTQQRSPLVDKNGWLVEEVIALHGVPLGDYFNLHLRYQVEDSYSKSKGCHVQVHIGIAWLKNTRHQKRIARNVISNLQQRLKTMFEAVDQFSR